MTTTIEVNTEKKTIFVSLSLNLVNLDRAVNKINAPFEFIDTPVTLNIVKHEETGVEGYELTGSDLDLFQVAMTYGALEERNQLLEYVSNRYDEIMESEF